MDTVSNIVIVLAILMATCCGDDTTHMPGDHGSMTTASVTMAHDAMMDHVTGSGMDHTMHNHGDHGHTDAGHDDHGVTDTGHGDHGHTDTDHGDHGDTDAGHGDHGHTDTDHGDHGHTDTDHGDHGHTDTGHGDHGDNDTGHGDHNDGSAAHTGGHPLAFFFSNDATILFVPWTTDDSNFVPSCVGVALVAVFYEGFKVLREYLLSKALVRSKNEKSCCTCFCGGMHLLQVILHVVQTAISYGLMLVFMTFNAWLCISLLIGTGFGYLVFGWTSRFNRTMQLNDLEHCN